MFDISKIRKDFPIFKRLINKKPIVFLDSTASSLKPQKVLDAINEYYTKYSVNIFRGVYKLSEEATSKYEEAREKVAKFINCQNPAEIIFVRNATEALNLVAHSWGKINIDQNCEIISTVMEHHANIVPWQELVKETRATLKYVDFSSRGRPASGWDEDGFLDLKKLSQLITPKSKLLALTYVSNVLGTINPVKKIIAMVKSLNPHIIVVVDAAQAVPHMKVDVADLGCDFLAFSGHKMLGPTGIGVLWGKYDLLEKMPPYQTGGEMIKEVTLEKSLFKEAPLKFEAGTPHIAGAIGLGAACEYLDSLGMENVREHDRQLTEYALSELGKLSNLSIYGPQKADDRGGIIAFNLFTKNKLIHPHDVAQILDRENIYIRSGHHCAMPLHRRLGIPASCRASFYIYNTKEDIDKLIEGIEKVRKIFKL